MANITIPTGYEVESIPEAINMVLPNKDAKFIYEVKPLGDNLSLSYTLNINKEIFLPDEYLALQRFYEMMYELTKKKIVLKKVSSSDKTPDKF